jgi:mono/diheme cytochrome c family protein
MNNTLRTLLLSAAAFLFSVAQAEEQRGAELYVEHCQSCHREKGEGIKGLIPPLTQSRILADQDEELIQVALQGSAYPSKLRQRSSKKAVMPGFAQLSDEDLATLLTRVRSSFSSGGKPLTATQVGAARKK